MQYEVDKNPNGNGSRPHADEGEASGRHVAVLPDVNAIVKGKTSDFQPWSEKAELTSLSSSGAGLFMASPCFVGRLVSLILPMPSHLRRYDEDKRLYRVWGLVQYCYEVGGDQTGFHVGVALIGKDAPDSYQQDPMTSYRVCGMRKNGLWNIEELDTAFKPRASVRYWNAVDITIFKLNEDLQSTSTETAVTENVSEAGAAIFSDLKVAVGDRIKVQSVEPTFSSLSIVRDRRIGPDDRARIHLEFVENPFPVLQLAPISYKPGSKD